MARDGFGDHGLARGGKSFEPLRLRRPTEVRFNSGVPRIRVFRIRD